MLFSYLDNFCTSRPIVGPLAYAYWHTNVSWYIVTFTLATGMLSLDGCYNLFDYIEMKIASMPLEVETPRPLWGVWRFEGLIFLLATCSIFLNQSLPFPTSWDSSFCPLSPHQPCPRAIFSQPQMAHQCFAKQMQFSLWVIMPIVFKPLFFPSHH